MFRAALALACASPVFACIWDSDTIKDELQMHADAFELITGQFPHHGHGHWEDRVTKRRAALEKDAGDIQARNDLGVALLKLGRFDEAQAEFEEIERREPGRYETYSNMGVMFKKMGDFEQAARYTELALGLKPEGHLGLGDYYLKMLEWKAARAKDPGAVPTHNFLGVSYADAHMFHGRTGVNSAADYERVKALIRSDRRFPDVLLVLGDELARRHSLNLAFWAWVRALQLDHPAKEEIQRRLSSVYGHWGHISKRESYRLPGEMWEAVAGIKDRLAQADQWLATFEATESEMAMAGSDPDFDAVGRELERRGVKKAQPGKFGLVKITYEEIRVAEIASAAAARAALLKEAIPEPPPDLRPLGVALGGGAALLMGALVILGRQRRGPEQVRRIASLERRRKIATG